MTAATRADLREGGAWSVSQRAKNDLIVALVMLSVAIARHVSRDHLVAFGRALGRVVHAVAWPLRRLATKNLAVAFPDADANARAEIARAAFSNLGGHVGGVIAALHEPLPLLDMAESSRKILRAALDEGRGVVLPSAHLGPWERLAATLVASGFPLTAVVRESYDPRLDALVTGVRDRAGVATIPRGGRGAPTRIVRTLRAGRVLGIPMDLRTRATSVTVPLLGGPAPTAVGPARIALRTGAPVVVCTVEGASFTVTCTRVDTADLGPNDAVELTARINAELGGRIRASAEHWPWFHARFSS